MLKYALINNNIVENVIVIESTDFIESIKSQYQHVEFIGDENNAKNIGVGYLWDGSKFFEDPAIVEQRKKQEEELIKQQEEYINSLKSKPSEQLTEQEKQILENIGKGV